MGNAEPAYLVTEDSGEASHSRHVLPTFSMELESNLEEIVQMLSPENLNKDHGRLAASTELSVAKSHSITSLRPCGSAGISVSLRSPRWSRLIPQSPTLLLPYGILSGRLLPKLLGEPDENAFRTPDVA
jgi:hypothetical protein